MYNILMYNILRGIFIGEMYIEQAQFSGPHIFQLIS